MIVNYFIQYYFIFFSFFIFNLNFTYLHNVTARKPFSFEPQPDLHKKDFCKKEIEQLVVVEKENLLFTLSGLPLTPPFFYNFFNDKNNNYK